LEHGAMAFSSSAFRFIVVLLLVSPIVFPTRHSRRPE
jgi:hypothetical protein